MKLKQHVHQTAVFLELSAEKENDSALTVKVDGIRIEGKGENLYLTVFLVENNISTNRQSGGGDGYVYQHVGRGVNETWGTPVEWTGNQYSGEVSFSLDKSWNFDNLEVIALMGLYDANDPTACTVENSAGLKLGTGAVDSVAGDEIKVVTGYYDLMGRNLISEPDKGIYVVQFSDGTSRKIMKR